MIYIYIIYMSEDFYSLFRLQTFWRTIKMSVTNEKPNKSKVITTHAKE